MSDINEDPYEMRLRVAKAAVLDSPATIAAWCRAMSDDPCCPDPYANAYGCLATLIEEQLPK